MRRVVLGFLLCALAYPVVVLLVGGPGAVGGAITVAFFTVGASVIVGLPLFALFKKRHWFRFWHYLAGGAFAGAVVSLPFAVSGWKGLLFFTGAFAGIGAAHAAVFWLIAVYRNKVLLSEPSNVIGISHHAR